MAGLQTTSAVLMIRPRCFGYNAETAHSNTHQQKPQESATEIQARAASEFATLSNLLQQNGITVHVFSDALEPATPDSIFPNNWFSTHQDGTLVLYPMAVPSRRAERRPHFIDELLRRLAVRRVVDLSHFEAREKFLEGTGSMVIDRVRGIAYAARSVRTHDEVLAEFAHAMGLQVIAFDTHERRGSPEYHTNVVMSIGARCAVICLDAIADAVQRATVEESLSQSGRAIIPISIEQMDEFAGNLLELRNSAGKNFWVMSTRAHESLSAQQKQQLSADAKLLHAPLSTIESVGGGSARCMLAELFFANACNC